MNTPTHVMLNALVLGRGRWLSHWLAISGGAVAPDLSMVFLFAYERVVRGTPERVIWSTRYFDPDWQLVVDLFNSFPLIGLGALVAWRLRATAWLAFFASMALHCVTDLLVHREDAHAHFFPLSSWRFISPVSYWDPRHYGWLVGPLELLLIVGGALVLFRSETRVWRRIGRGVLVATVVFIAFAVTNWAF
ncbi:MAG TPA: hypothetical protein EYQ83_15290 [Acidobacteria bacterium]|nr:hypothetical protein [Acidobacteriota bacterium]